MSGSWQPVTIGPIALTGLEVPEVFDRSASMQPAIHRLIGGGRVVQLLGANPRVRELRGVLAGEGAVDRAVTLEALRDSGAVVVLTIGAWSENVVVTALELQYTARGSVIRYRLQAEALPAVAGSLSTTVSAVIGAAVADLGQAVASIGVAGLASLGAAASALGNDGTSLAAAGSATSTPSLDITAAASSLSLAIDGAGGTLVSLSGAATPDIVGNAGALAAASANARVLAAAVQAGGYLNRASASVAALGGTTVPAAIHS